MERGIHTLTVQFSGDDTLAPSQASWDYEILTPAESFVRQAYQSILVRPPEPTALATWVAAREGGMAPQVITRRIAASTEAKQRLVRLSYWRVFNRAPDPAGLAHWTNQLSNLRAEDLLAALFASGEAARLGLDQPENLVELLYRVHLDRGPDGGAAYWIERLEADPRPRGRQQVALAFGRTSEATRVAVLQGQLASCGPTRIPPGADEYLRGFWADSGRHPIRLAGEYVALICPRLP